MAQKNVNNPDELGLYELDLIKENFQKKNFIPGEDWIYLKTAEVDKENAERLIESGGMYLQINNKSIVQLAAELRTGAITDLQAIAQDISTPESCSYVTGLKMFYALENGNFVLYYRPVKLCRTSVTYGGGGYKYGNYDLYENVNSYYHYDGNDFKEETNPVKLADITKHINTYKDSTDGIKIRHIALPDIPFTPHTGDDIKAVTFSFQEFFALMDADSATTTIRVWNVVEGDEYPNSSYIQHTLLLSTDKITSKNGDVKISHGFTNSFANLSHLCPPSCNKYFLYRLFKRLELLEAMK